MENRDVPDQMGELVALTPQPGCVALGRSLA